MATDGSSSAERAVDQALDLAKTFGAELYCISVIDTRRYGDSMLSDSEQVLGELEEFADEIDFLPRQLCTLSSNVRV